MSTKNDDFAWLMGCFIVIGGMLSAAFLFVLVVRYAWRLAS